jgi:hypothetical protein
MPELQAAAAAPGRERNTPITDGMLALFAEIDSAPTALRRSQEFLNTRAEPCHPRGYLANDDWHRCREVRLALLTALAALDKGAPWRRS